jgi:hypothetical protein
MKGSDVSLPAGFEALEPFVGAWAMETAEKRHQARLTSSDAERQAFFDAAEGLLGPGLDYLDQRSLADFSPSDRRLMTLLLGLAHVSLAVEMQGDDEPKHALGARHMTITRAPADRSLEPARWD